MDSAKLLTLIGSVILVIFLVAGCSGTPAAPPMAEGTITTNTPVPPEATLYPTYTPYLTHTQVPPPDTATPTWTPTPIPATSTPDPCADAITSDARLKYTFEEIVPCLNTPENLVTFMSGNLGWDNGWDNSFYGENTYSPAREVYENGIDDCDGLAEFAACVLNQNGYEAYNVGISIMGPSGHNVTGYVGKDGLKYAINNGQSIDGPFDTWEELAQFYIDNGMASPPNGVLWLFSPCFSDRAVGDAVLDLPHTVLR
jgi:hypothetical protein